MTKNTESQPTGKTFDSVNSFIKMIQSHTRCNSMKAHTAWMPASLYPNGKGDYAPLNVHGFLIGETQHKKIPKDWVIGADDLDLGDLDANEDGSINLLSYGYPWETEENKSAYLGRIKKLFRVPVNVSRRPISERQPYVGG